jgi:hypothetical protein
MTYPLTSGTTSSFGVPLLDLPALTGFAATVTSNTIGVTNVSWTPNQFVNGGAVYFVAIRNGAQAGRTLLVIGNTSNTLTLDVEDTPLEYSGFAVAVGADSIELFQGDSLGSLFGSSANGSGFLSSGLKGGTTSTNADNVRLFDGSAFVTYFFNTTVGTWVRSGGGTTNQNGLILYPDDGMLIVTSCTKRKPDIPGPSAIDSSADQVPWRNNQRRCDSVPVRYDARWFEFWSPRNVACGIECLRCGYGECLDGLEMAGLFQEP